MSVGKPQYWQVCIFVSIKIVDSGVRLSETDPNVNKQQEIDMKKTVLIAACFAAITGCTDDTVSFDTLETQRAIANDNSRYNAQKWRAENGHEDKGLLARGDSTQQAKCPQGDGWASVDLTHPQTKQPVVKLKCSTVSANVGCVKDEDFKARAVLANQENHCNSDIPPQLKKIEQ